MTPLKKIIIALISFIFLGWFICQPLIDIGIYKPYYKMSETKHKISHKELNAFLSVWSKMMQTRFGENFKQKSLKSKSQYPIGFKKWLRLQYWDIERFLYDEERIRSLLEYSDIKLQLEENKQIIKKHHQINLKDIVNDLEKRLSTKSFDGEELNLIEANRYQIFEILSGRAILKEK